MPDVDGYPTTDELTAIRTFEGSPRAWFDLIKAAWWAADWGWNEENTTDAALYEIALDLPGTTLHLSTGGWSGNESLIDAMRANNWLWLQTWYATRRGGHYTFTFSTDGTIDL